MVCSMRMCVGRGYVGGVCLCELICVCVILYAVQLFACVQCGVCVCAVCVCVCAVCVCVCVQCVCVCAVCVCVCVCSVSDPHSTLHRANCSVCGQIGRESTAMSQLITTPTRYTHQIYTNNT